MPTGEDRVCTTESSAMDPVGKQIAPSFNLARLKFFTLMGFFLIRFTNSNTKRMDLTLLYSAVAVSCLVAA
jgi:hypothetical protein